MIRYLEIIDAINNKLISIAPNIKIANYDLKEGIPNPCFKVKLDGIKESSFMNECRDRKLSIRVYYFPQNTNKCRDELLNILDDLSIAFGRNRLLKIDDNNIIEIIEDIESDIIDDVLHFYIPILISEDYEDDSETPYLSELEVGTIKFNL